MVGSISILQQLHDTLRRPDGASLSQRSFSARHDRGQYEGQINDIKERTIGFRGFAASKYAPTIITAVY
jgi:hypothetical protein